MTNPKLEELTEAPKVDGSPVRRSLRDTKLAQVVPELRPILDALETPEGSPPNQLQGTRSPEILKELGHKAHRPELVKHTLTSAFLLLLAHITPLL
jgi:hypothetical protein